MTPIADMVEQMLQRGLPADVIVLAVRTAEQAAAPVVRQSAEHPVDAATEKRRAYDRERQRKIRELRRQSADNPQMSQEALTLSSLSIEEGNSKKEGKKERARKHLLSADWQPSEVHFEAAAKLGVSREAVLNKAEDMRIWAGANGTLKKDWDLTFHGFIRRDAPKLAAHNGKQNGLRPSDPARSEFRDAIAELKAFNRGSATGSGGGGAPVRLLRPPGGG